MKNNKATIDGYAVSSEIRKILIDEGSLALRIIPENSEKIKLCETLKIQKGNPLPEGADLVLAPEKVSDYATVAVIDTLG
ncbi:MAG: hypothetical protein ACOYJ1_08085 [Peptococcales bacterium]|jgi:molybdopterin biosynthesis enzyme